jgi:hypothetical protein
MQRSLFHLAFLCVLKPTFLDLTGLLIPSSRDKTGKLPFHESAADL